MKFDYIAIIFNPESTGDAPELAKKLQKDLKKRKINSHLAPTEHAGHAIELTRDISKAYKKPLIVSVSGDGGYNEVLNGAMEAKKEQKTARPVIAVMAAGNANDHRRVMRDEPLARLIARGDVQPMDIISIKSDKHYRYAHSYIGFGLTPQAGHMLNSLGKTKALEVFVVLRAFLKLNGVTIKRNGASRKVYSLIFANINEMAKFIKLDQRNTVHDDKFEVVEYPADNKFMLAVRLIVAAIRGEKQPEKFSSYSFSVTKNQPIQLDGEIEHIEAEKEITIRSHHHAIDCLF